MTAPPKSNFLVASAALCEIVSEHAQNVQIPSSGACARSHPSSCAPLKYSIVFNDSVCGQEDPDQTARVRRLRIWAFAVRICSKTRFRMVHILLKMSFL